jgi:hypothetical protein
MSQKPDYIRTRSFLAANVEILLENLSARKQAGKIDADDLFGDMGAEAATQAVPWQKNFDHISKLKILVAEKESLGLYVSGNPLTDYDQLQSWVREVTLKDDVHLIIINKSKKIFTKTNAMMFALQISTTEEELEAIIFPKIALDLSPKIEEKEIFWVKGRINRSKKSKAGKPKESLAVVEEEVEDTVNIDEEIGGETSELVTDTGPEIQEEIREYDELPKLLVEWMVPFVDGVLPLFAGEEIKLAVSRQKKLENINWADLKLNPAEYLKYADENQAASQKPSHTGSNTISPALLAEPPKTEPASQQSPLPVYLNRTLGPSKLKEFRENLRTNEEPELVQVEVWVEGADGFKKAKGMFWLDEKIASAYSNKMAK